MKFKFTIYTCLKEEKHKTAQVTTSSLITYLCIFINLYVVLFFASWMQIIVFYKAMVYQRYIYIFHTKTFTFFPLMNVVGPIIILRIGIRAYTKQQWCYLYMLFWLDMKLLLRYIKVWPKVLAIKGIFYC